MAFVKLDCGMLDSTIWIDRDARELFITALLMAEPRELVEPAKQIEVRTLNETGFIVPPGWYGFVPAAGIGIIRRAGMEPEKGFAALERLGNPEKDSRTPDFEGRRLVRIDGGYLALNFDKYRQKDYTSAARSRRYRERNSSKPSRVSNVASRVASRSVTQAEAEAEAKAEAKGEAVKKSPPAPVIPLLLQTPAFQEAWGRWNDHLRQKRKPATSHALDLQLKKLEGWGEKRAIAAINNSIMGNWQGIFEEKTNANGFQKPPLASRPTGGNL